MELNKVEIKHTQEKECDYCGIRYNHIHGENTEPRDFERIDREFMDKEKEELGTDVPYDEPKIILYAITNNGEGTVRKIGEYESVEDIDDIHVGMFSPTTVLRFELDYK